MFHLKLRSSLAEQRIISFCLQSYNRCCGYNTALLMGNLTIYKFLFINLKGFVKKTQGVMLNEFDGSESMRRSIFPAHRYI